MPRSLRRWRVGAVQTGGGFEGDPAAALSVVGSGGCCGNPSAELVLPDPADAALVPCCGTQAEAAASSGCCGAAAKAEAVASAQGCCG
jgi:hypothetical protein